MDKESEKCSVGLCLEEVCTEDFVSSITEQEMKLLCLRSGCPSVTSLCYSHKNTFLDNFFCSQRRLCSNPLQSELHGKGTDVHIITQRMSENYSQIASIDTVKVAPGNRICRQCRDKINALLREANEPPTLSPAVLPGNMGIHSQRSGAGSGSENSPPIPILIPFCDEEVPVLNPEEKTITAEQVGSEDLSEASTRYLAAKSSASSSGDFFRTPKFVKEYNKLKVIAQTLDVYLPPVDELRRNNKLTLDKLLELQREIKKSVLGVSNKVPRFLNHENPVNVPIDFEDVCCEMFIQIRECLQSKKSKLQKKIQLLSILPNSWSARHISMEFEVGKKIALRTKNLVKDHGLIPNILPKFGSRTLPEETVLEVKNWYLSQDVSRELPGMKDVKRVKENGKCVLKRKRLFLTTLKEGYQLFKSSHPEKKIGFTTFAALRPKEVVLAGQAGTHTVCVCTYHENVKLMLSSASLDNLKDLQASTTGFASENLTYQACLAKIICNPPNIPCFLRKCPCCPGKETLREEIEVIMDERMVEQVEFKQWTGTDRSTLLTIILEVDDFIDRLTDLLEELLTHDYVSKTQARFLRETKSLLPVDEVVCIVDFSENLTFVIQKAAQGVHWKSDQATLCPFISYCKTNQNQKDPEIDNFVVISDYNKHSTTAFYTMQKKYVAHLKEKFPGLKRIKYFSDGAAQHFKNKYNAANLMYHKEEFNVEAEWHYFATSHGKGPADGLAGNAKSCARKHALKGNDILTATQLYDFLNDKERFPKVKFSYVSTDEVLEEEKRLTERFQTSIAVPKIKFVVHPIVPMSDTSAKVSRDSYGNEGVVVTLRKNIRMATNPDSPAPLQACPDTETNQASSSATVPSPILSTGSKKRRKRAPSGMARK